MKRGPVLLASTLLVALVLAGCIGDPGGAAGGASGTDGGPEGPRTGHGDLAGASLDLVSDRLRVSPSGHRMDEFAVARDPTDPDHVAVGAVDLDAPDGGPSCVVLTSADGGRSWSPPTAPEDPWTFQFDPWVAFDAQGRLHLVCLRITTHDQPRQAMVHARSDDGGRTWGPWTEISNRDGPDSFDKIAVGTLGADDVFVCGVSGGAFTIAASGDGGETWDPAVPVLNGTRGTCNGFVQGPDGGLYVAYRGGAGAANRSGSVVGVVASFDGGRTWVGPRAAGPIDFHDSDPDHPECQVNLPGGACPVLRYMPSMQSLAVDPVTGDLFLAWNTYADGGYEVRLHRSSDRGRTWEPIAVDAIEARAEACAPCNFSRPQVHVDDAGRLGLLWVVSGENDLDRKEFWFAVSVDAGETWLPAVVLGQEDASSLAYPMNYVPRADPEMAEGLARALTSSSSPEDVADHAAAPAGQAFMSVVHQGGTGDYWGMTSTPAGFLPMWTDHAGSGKATIWTRHAVVADRGAASGDGGPPPER